MTRHASLSEQLKALMAYRSRPEGPVEPVQTNWTTVATNDNAREDRDGLFIERRRSIRPTVGEIQAAIESGEIEKNAAGQIIRIGNLRFSDGTQTEKAQKFSVDGKLVDYDAVLPVGAMMGTKDKQERMLGGDELPSNVNYTLVYGARHPIVAARKSPETRATEIMAPERTKAEMRAEIAALPDFPVTRLKTGFPWKPERLRELFCGLEKGKKGETGSVAWEDIATSRSRRAAWSETVAALSVEDKTTLDSAMVASTMADIGPGGSRRTKFRRGKARLIAANDNLAVAIKKYVA